jgi:hypothetical protein
MKYLCYFHHCKICFIVGEHFRKRVQSPLKTTEQVESLPSAGPELPPRCPSFKNPIIKENESVPISSQTPTQILDEATDVTSPASPVIKSSKRRPIPRQNLKGNVRLDTISEENLSTPTKKHTNSELRTPPQPEPRPKLSRENSISQTEGTRKSSRPHKPSSRYSSESFILGGKQSRERQPPQLVGFIPGNISPRISPNQLKRRRRRQAAGHGDTIPEEHSDPSHQTEPSPPFITTFDYGRGIDCDTSGENFDGGSSDDETGQSESQVPTVPPTPVASTIPSVPPPSRYLY